MFKTISFYRLENFQSPDLEALAQAMAGGAFVPCTPTQPESSGWVAPRGKKSLALAERVGGHLQRSRLRRPANARTRHPDRVQGAQSVAPGADPL